MASAGSGTVCRQGHREANHGDRVQRNRPPQRGGHQEGEDVHSSGQEAGAPAVTLRSLVRSEDGDGSYRGAYCLFLSGDFQNREVFMFRIDSEHVVDATRTGGLAR